MRRGFLWRPAYRTALHTAERTLAHCAVLRRTDIAHQDSAGAGVNEKRPHDAELDRLRNCCFFAQVDCPTDTYGAGFRVCKASAFDTVGLQHFGNQVRFEIHGSEPVVAL